MSYLSRSFYESIAMGAFTNIIPWSKAGYTPTVNTTESDIWSAAGVYAYCTTAGIWEVLSSDNTVDKATSLHSGSTTTGGSTTTLEKSGENFLTTTAAGDFIIVDAGGTTPEWGVITAVDSDTKITFSGGLSSGGTGNGRSTYNILDKSAYAGAQAVIIRGLDSTYAEISEIVVLNGTTAVDTTKNFFRVNHFRMICAGTNNRPTGNLTLRADGAGATYDYITAAFTRARNNIYTVPTGKTLYVTSWNVGWGTTNAANFQGARLYTRANVDNLTGYNTGNIFYPYSEVLLLNNTLHIDFDIPTKLPAKTDIKVSALAFTGGSGPATSILRGFLVS